MARPPPAQPPPFAKEWMASWRAAAPRLQEIRDRELREMQPDDAVRAAEVVSPMAVLSAGVTRVEYSGLIEQQAWFMRLRILQALRAAG